MRRQAPIYKKEGELMALSSVAMEIVNNPIKGYVEYVSTKQENPSEEIMYVLIYRKKHNTDQDYIRVYEKVIVSLDSLTFTDYDITARSGTSYDYLIELTDGNEAGYQVIEYGRVENVTCWFDGLFIGNDEKQYLAPLNCSTSYARNTQANYVMTLNGRTPYRISNANTNYATGQSSALFAMLDEHNQPVVAGAREYVEEAIDFLTDGTQKVLKTSDGDAWYVSVDSTVNVPSNDHYIGLDMIDFSWTETGDLPVLKKVVAQ